MLHRVIENLRNRPQDICYEINGAVYRNWELDRDIGRIYRYLRKNNPSRTPVVVCGQKEFYMLASFLACACAGMPYVPMDNSIPEGRKRRILEQVHPLITIDQALQMRLQEEPPLDLTEICIGDEDVVYIIFTSGSTGEPKGVQITYRNLKSCMKWLESICGIQNSVILNQASYSFDLSVADLYLPLLTGSRHYILEQGIQKDYARLFCALRQSNAELAVFTPSFLDLLLADKSFNAGLMPKLKAVLLCGEKLMRKTVESLLERFPGIRLLNCYGPTECTFAVTSAEITDPDDLPIGTPKDDTELLVVNDRIEELGEGETGELLIVGQSVGKGYLNQPGDRRFLQYKGRNAFLTGDYGYWKQNKLYCIGRKDTQIKWNGYRIELAEIEEALMRLESVERAAVAAKKRDGRVSRIVAFVKQKQGCCVGPEEMRKLLKTELPVYMIPRIRLVKGFPLTANGKIDTQKLLEEMT